MVSMSPVGKTGDSGLGLRDVGHRVLNYRTLAARSPNKDTRGPPRLLELHLTGISKPTPHSEHARQPNT